MLTYSLGDGYKPNKGYKPSYTSVPFAKCDLYKLYRHHQVVREILATLPLVNFNPAFSYPFAMEVLQTSQRYLSHVTYATILPRPPKKYLGIVA